MDGVIIQEAQGFVDETEVPTFVGKTRGYCEVIIPLASGILIKNTHDHIRNRVTIGIMYTTREFELHNVTPSDWIIANATHQIPII
jgi:hypothetical protein